MDDINSMKRGSTDLKRNKSSHTLFFLSLLILSLLSSCTLPGISHTVSDTVQPATEAAADFGSFLDDLFLEEVTSNTINLHFTLSDPESFGITETPITLGDISEQSFLTSNAELENTLSVLLSYDYESLPLNQQLTYDLLQDYLNTQLSIADLTLYDEILRPSTGIQSQLPVLYEEYRFYDEDDIKDYLNLIPLTGEYFQQIIEFEQRKADAGLFMSDFACNTIISQCEEFIKNPEGHYLIETFNNKVNNLASLSDTARNEYITRNETLIKEQVLPAYQKLADALNKLLGSGKNDMGLCYLPKGTDYYKYLVYYNTGCSAEIPDIQTMIEDKRNSDLLESAALMNEDARLWQECKNVSLSGMDAVSTLNVLKDEMLTQFPAAPDAGFTVSYIDECMAEYMAPAFYITSPIDNFENNSIFINALTDTSTMRYFTTLAHEGFPGHLYQTVMSYQAGMEPVRSTLNYPGYVEGWATYVEMLSYHYAKLDEQVAELLESNQSALLSLYASTDIGIHYEGWSFADTVSFWSEYGISDSQSLREVYELIVEEPAHYLKYYVGYLEFLNLKEIAEEKYGNDYSDIAFHQALLDIGPAPFDIVEKYLDAYYAAED